MQKSVVLAAIVALASACGSDTPVAPIAPSSGFEPVQVRTVERSRIAGEPLPAVRFTVAPATVAFEVTRASLCLTIATVGAYREGSTIAFVARVGGDPGANCAANAGVVTYTSQVGLVPAGTYDVQLFEAVGSGDPVYLSSERVTVQSNLANAR